MNPESGCWSYIYDVIDAFVTGGRREGEFGRCSRHHHNEEDRGVSAGEHAGDAIQSDVGRGHLRLPLVQP